MVTESDTDTKSSPEPAQDATPPASANGDSRDRALPASPSSGAKGQDGPSRFMWSGLLVVYLILFATTGYLAFARDDKNPAFERREQIAGIQDAATRTLVLESLQRENSEHSKRQDFASQSFNVVLGALLGFLSASATSSMKRKSGSA
jgi:hypothetical protein